MISDIICGNMWGQQFKDKPNTKGQMGFCGILIENALA